MKYSFLHLAALSMLLIASTTTVPAVSAEERQCTQTDMKACFESEVDTLSAEEKSLIMNTFERFSEEQKKSALNIFSESAGAKDAIAAVALENVPLGLHEAIIQEAKANGADSDFDLPAFEEGLLELQQTGDMNAYTFDGMVELAPIATSQLPIYIRSQAAQQRLVDAQGRLVDAQGRLVDAQGRLVDAQNVGEQLDKITDQLEN